jgi:hypothetical protein
VQDLAVWLPLMAVGAWWLWRRTGRGVVVVGSLLVMWVVEGIGIAVDQAWGMPPIRHARSRRGRWPTCSRPLPSSASSQ